MSQRLVYPSCGQLSVDLASERLKESLLQETPVVGLPDAQEQSDGRLHTLFPSIWSVLVF